MEGRIEKRHKADQDDLMPEAYYHQEISKLEDQLAQLDVNGDAEAASPAKPSSPLHLFTQAYTKVSETNDLVRIQYENTLPAWVQDILGVKVDDLVNLRGLTPTTSS